MQDLRKLSSLAEAEIDALVADGINPTPAEIVAINAAAWAVESPETRMLLSRGVPVEVGGVTLWPMTQYGADWFSRVGARLPGSLLQTCALAYALQHGRSDGGQLDIGPFRAAAVLARWRARLRCRQAELVEAISQVVDQDAQPEEPPADKGSTITPGDLSAYLVAHVGGSPAVWERQVSVGYVHALISAILAQDKADGRPSASDPRIRANRALGWLVEMIRRNHAKEDASGR